MNLVYAPRALRDIHEILAFIKERSPQGARNVSFAIEHMAEVCANSPRGGTPTDQADVYRWPLTAYKYTIFYRFIPELDEVEIICVVRGTRIRNLRRVPE